MRKSEIWWARLHPPAGRRPVVLLSRDEAYAVRTAVAVAPISTTIRSIPVEVPLGREDGLPGDCAVNLDSIVTIPKSALESRISFLSEPKRSAVREALKFALDL